MSSLKFTMEIKAKDEFIAAVAPFAQAMHKLTHELDEGIIQYDLYTDKADESVFYFVEEWKDEESLKAHKQKDHYKRFIDFLEESVLFVNKMDGGIDISTLTKYEEMK